MAFIDEVVIRVQSGAGGNGCISFRREKYIPKGGPDGGNGGAGGSVYLRATRDKSSLLDFKFQPRYEGQRGQHGMGSDCDGRGGEDLIISVPMGTLVYDEDGDLLFDLTQDEQLELIAEGGRGGRGNRTFATSRLRAPRIATPGRPGVARELRLELRLLADVGLIGFPNAGKSSLLGRISRAHPKVADYPFTTLEPHLGVVDHKDVTFVVADLPGLIEGASEGTGLGHKFLKHVRRTRVLLHLVDLSQPEKEMLKNIEIIRDELKQFDEELLNRQEILVFSKADLFDEAGLSKKLKALKKLGLEGTAISSQSGYGIEALLDTLSAGHLAHKLEQEQLSSPAESDYPSTSATSPGA